ncbi:3-phosphoshikimate 1-carboxyvinyltransferase [Pseudalkalibacillus caeni]|uniref:3-phosphoshikimate 1-carboxyvinyltransferase n=1 Tax=Exobacillus caeni TaxID=2574798 RepID=A0A5R9F508_9BACL|nr:3-phosphoshikimate 1-carboxyvinyltransferase [Pseudalkalibacillus caeni]TLS35903.1 3-phosphoshikimate 1-carboxyvinyltransferase [Pseudalkalibacillus caeni]
MGIRKIENNNRSLKGSIKVPGDKSISHRAVMFGSMANGITEVTGFLNGEDCLSTIKCFKSLGVEIEHKGESLRIHGKGLEGLQEPLSPLDVGNSGTTARLLLGILAGRPFHSVLVGDASISKRPMDRVTIPLQKMGAKIDGRENGSLTPISVRGGGLQAITYDSPVASAQVKSSLILAALQAEGTTTLSEPFLSRDHTERMLKSFGASVSRNEGQVIVKGGQKLTGTKVSVPADISSAAFFLAAAAITPGSDITLTDVGINSTRSGIIDVLQEMGANLAINNKREENGEEVADLHITSSELEGITIEGEMIPRLIDEIPVIALLATQAEGKTVIKDAAELKVKETNRIDAVVTQLAKLGASVTATDDGMIIEGKTKLNGGPVTSLGDHRIGMSLAVAGCIADSPVELELADAISVSYPNFFEDLEKLRT